MKQEMEVTLKNDLAELNRLAEVTEKFGEAHHWPAKETYGVNLSLDELVTNVISYGYDDGAEHQISIRFSFENGLLTLVMVDDGRPFDPSATPDPQLDQPLEERMAGGLGIFLVRKIMDQVEYRREAEKNIFVMKKQIQSGRIEKEKRDGDR